MRGIVMFLIFATLILSSLTGYQLIEARQTHTALCAFRFDLQTRYDSGAKILAEHPENPVHIYGLAIPRDQLISSHQSQESALRALRRLNCN